MAVYVREAHPTDGWRMTSNDNAGIAFAQPQAKGEREALAKKCCSSLEITMPILVDTMDDRVGHTYSGMPDRLYVIDRDGRIAYKGGRGPFGFKSREMEQALVLLLLDQSQAARRTAHGLPVLSGAEAWARLPSAEQGAGQPLPAWARALVDALPRTTAAMLELDYLHRAKSPLGPVLAGKVRWTAAHANRCAYTEATAAADLRRAGVREAEIRALADGNPNAPAAERATLAFARKLTLDAGSVTDAEMGQILGQYGNRQTVALVQMLAYANFQDRLVLSLGLTAEEGGPLPPVNVRFARNMAAGPPVPERAPPAADPAGGDGRVTDTEWVSLDLGQLHQQMETQRQRQPRILVPSWEEVRAAMPAASANRPPLRIRWSLVCMGYQPELARGWGACMQTFAQEARQDRVFEETLFWVITRTLHCFY